MSLTNPRPVWPNLISAPTPSSNNARSPPPLSLYPTGAVSASIAEEELGARLPRLRSSCRLRLALLCRLSNV